MYKIFLSHAHADLARASAIYRRLLALGQTVWMDESPLDPESSHGFVGIPAGQPHREVIAEAIAESAAFLICDSPAWRASDYCQDELAMAQEAGVRIAVLNPRTGDALDLPAVRGADDALPALVEVLERDVEIALAHIRLDEARQGKRAQPWWHAMFGDHERLADATHVLTTVPGPGVPTARPELTDYAREVTTSAMTGRRRRRRATLGLLAVLTGLAILATVAGIDASRDAAAAAAAARRATSIDLAAESLAAAQPDSVALANRAWETDRNSESRSAMAVAAAAARAVEVSRFPGVSRPYQLIELDDGRFAVSQAIELFVGAPDREPTRIALTDSIGQNPLYHAGGALYARRITNDILVRIPLDGRPPSRSAVPSVTAIAKHDGTIWLATNAGVVGTYDPEADRLNPVVTVELPVTALDVTSEDVVVLTRNAKLFRFERTAAGLNRRGVTELTALTAPAPSPQIGPDWRSGDSDGVRRLASAPGFSQRTYLDRVITCGTTTHVLLGSRRFGFAAAVHLALNGDSTPVLPITNDIGITSLACTAAGELIGAGYGRLGPAVFRPGQLTPAGLITSANRLGYAAITRLADGRYAAIDSNSNLIRSTEGGAVSRSLGTASFLMPTSDSILAQDIDGTLFTVDRDGATAAVGRLREPLRTHLGRPGAALAMSADAMYLIGPHGVERRWRQPSDVVAARSLDFEGRTALVLLPDRIRVFPLDGGPTRDVPLPSLDDGDALADIAMTHGILFASTRGGRVVRLDPVSGAIQATWMPPRLGRLLIEVRPTDDAGLVVFGSDGVVRLLDENLAVTASRYLGASAGLLASNVKAKSVLTVTAGSRLHLLDGRTLEPRQAFDATGLDNAFLSADGTQVIEAAYYRRAVYGAVPVMMRLREQAAATGRVPAPKKDENESEATITITPTCADCAPR